MVGETVSHYRILEKVGAGGMGEVYRAHDGRLGRDVAVKVLPKDVSRDVERLARFDREARTLAALSHPNILAIYDVGTERGVAYLVTELLEGETLRQRLTRERLPWRKSIEIAASVADGLAAAHGRGIIHRDVKPENVFLTNDGRTKVLDFGLVRLQAALAPVAAAATTISDAGTALGTVLGTPGYMAPEQVRGQAADARSDIFSLGALLYEMIAGERAFARDTAAEAIAAILKDPAPEISVSGLEVSLELNRIVAHCLEKNPGERFQSASDLAFHLKSLLSGSSSERARSGIADAAGPSDLRSIAVLPFTNLSPDPEQEYFCDGMTEEIITALSKIRGLRVISRNSVMRLKGTAKTMREISDLLNATHVIEGSVRIAGNHLRIVAQLIDTATDGNLWAERYSGTVDDVFDIQEKVARAITDALQVRLSPEEQRRLARPTVSHEAHEAYLKGQFHYYKLSPGNFDRAFSYFQFALEIDPGYAPAHAGIANVWLLRADTGYMPSAEAVPKARAAVLRALELDETHAEGHSTLANLLWIYDRDWPAGEREFRRALELNPNSADAHFMFADFLISMKRFQDWAPELPRVLELDPVNPFFHCFYGWHLVYLNRCDEAVAQLREALAAAPDFSSAHMGLWGAFYRKGMREEALAEAGRFFAVLGDREVEEALWRGHANGGYCAAMRCGAETLVDRSKRSHVPAVRIARLYAHAGEKDQALEWLGRAFEQAETPLVHLSVAWDWDILRGDPRFDDLLARLGLPK